MAKKAVSAPKPRQGFYLNHHGVGGKIAKALCEEAVSRFKLRHADAIVHDGRNALATSRRLTNPERQYLLGFVSGLAHANYDIE